MEVMGCAGIRIREASGVAEVRRQIATQAKDLQWSETALGKAHLVATELVSNLHKHAKNGAVCVCSFRNPGASRIQLCAVDRGPGMEDIDRCLRDGFSTAGSPGTGLGAITRLASRFDLLSTPGKGTVIVADIDQGTIQGNALWSVGATGVPHPGESINGDAWTVVEAGDLIAIALCDGLGHGPLAAAASNLAMQAVDARPIDHPRAIMERMHEALKPTRGAAAAVAVIDRVQGQVKYCGIGNISASVIDQGRSRSLVSHNGTVGHIAPRFGEFSYPWNADSTLVMHSDGLMTHWKPSDWLGLWRREPAVIAGTLYRDCVRGNDDATVVVVRAA